MKNKIRELRARHRLSQSALAEVIGVSRQTIHAIENDKYDPTLALAFQLSYVLKEPVDEIFDKTDYFKKLGKTRDD